jgi:hypothetical protein
MKRRVVWVSFSPLEKTREGWTSRMASVRYRLLVPAVALQGEYDSKVIHIPAGANRRTLLERFKGAHAVVLGKLFGPFKEDPEQVPALVKALRAQDTTVLADYSDDHFTDPVQGAAYRALANVVNRVVASTPGLAEVLKDFTAAPVSVITDPVEGQQQAARVPSQSPCRLLWFGNVQNLDTLNHGLPQLAKLADSVPHSLTLVTAAGAGAEAMAGTRFRPWSLEALWQELRDCDAVVIPSNPYDPHKAVKSPNRFTESVWAGRFVLAHPLPAYEELAEFGWVGEDLGEGLRWLAGHGDEALQRIRRGQAAIAERFSPRAIGAAWKQAIERVVRRP